MHRNTSSLLPRIVHFLDVVELAARSVKWRCSIKKMNVVGFKNQNPTGQPLKSKETLNPVRAAFAVSPTKF
jgi:hypothetical protein